jgi:hypothetical protein
MTTGDQSGAEKSRILVCFRARTQAEPGQLGDGETSGAADGEEPKLINLFGKSWKRVAIISIKPRNASNWHGS